MKSKSGRMFITLALGLGLPLALLWLLSGGTPHMARAQGQDYYVAPGGDCGGASPCYTTIQAAVDAASNSDTIKVAQGVYTSTAFQVVYITKAITLTGGYITTDWVNSYPVTRPTVIDAENVARRRGIYVDGTGVATITLAGLTIQRGYAQNATGGGVYIVSGTVAMQANQVLTNTATGSDAAAVFINDGTVMLVGHLS